MEEELRGALSELCEENSVLRVENLSLLKRLELAEVTTEKINVLQKVLTGLQEEMTELQKELTTALDEKKNAEKERDCWKKNAGKLEKELEKVHNGSEVSSSVEHVSGSTGL